MSASIALNEESIHAEIERQCPGLENVTTLRLDERERFIRTSASLVRV